MLLISSVLGVLAGLSNGASSVLQRVGARRTHSDSAVGIGALRRLAHKPAWLAGIGTTLFGFGLQAGALATGPIALVQPLLTLELPCTLLLSGVVFGSRLRTREWSAALGMTAGLALLVVALRPSSGEPLAAGASTWVVALAANAAISLALTAVGLRRHNAPRAALLGLAAGAGFALTAALMSAITAAFGSGVGVLLSTWQTYVMIAAAPGGFFLLQNAIRAGRLAASQPGLTLGNPVISLAWGTLVFGESVRGGPWVVAEVAGALAVCGCTVLLARSPLLHGRQGGSETDRETEPAGHANN